MGLKVDTIQNPSSAPVNLTLDASGNVAVGNNMTVAGTTTLTGGVTQTGSSTAASFIPSGSTVPTNGVFLPSANTVAFATNSTNQVSISSAGIVTGTAGNLMLVQGTSQASTSGTSITFTGIPSWVKRITITFAGVATAGQPMVQLGTGATPTYTTSGYVGAADNRASTSILTTGFGVAYGSNYTVSGQMVLCLNSTNTWTEAVTTFQSTFVTCWGAGYVALGAALTAIRVTTVSGTDTFTAGTINIQYE